MKKSVWFILFLFVLVLPMSAQRNSDYGVFGGLSSYYGDINTTSLMYSPSPAVGFIYRYNFNPRQAVRAHLIYGGLKGSDLDFANDFQQTRAHSFNNSFIEWGAQYEFNFFAYSTAGKWGEYSPYFAGGIALTFLSWPYFTYTPVIPLSVGLKMNIHKNTGLELEYGFRKTFYDNFDGLKDNIDPEHWGWFSNNDWYMFAGVTFTWKLFHNLGTCPTYYDVRKKKKRQLK